MVTLARDVAAKPLGFVVAVRSGTTATLSSGECRIRPAFDHVERAVIGSPTRLWSHAARALDDPSDTRILLQPTTCQIGAYRR